MKKCWYKVLLLAVTLFFTELFFLPIDGRDLLMDAIILGSFAMGTLNGLDSK